MDRKEKLVKLFTYLKELNALKYNVVNHIRDEIWSTYIKDLPREEEYLKVVFLRETEGCYPLLEEENYILKIKKPELQPVPLPPEPIFEWLIRGWDNERVQAAHKEEALLTEGKEKVIVAFSDDQRRVDLWEAWLNLRNDWAKRQLKIVAIRKLFDDLYKIYADLRREPDTWELMLGQGFLTCLDEVGALIDYPLLAKRLRLTFDPQENTLLLHNSDVPTELNMSLLQMIPGFNGREGQTLKEDLAQHDYHPLDEKDTVDYLERLCYSLYQNSHFERDAFVSHRAEEVVVYLQPVFFLRKRTGGLLSSIDAIIEDIQETSYVPDSLLNILGIEDKKMIQDRPTVTEKPNLIGLANGEDEHILLSKEANQEQLEIAKRIEKYPAVLVQGPPGTGKTHTIANLVGHFLAQGKSILVTSHTSKALSVLKDKIADGLKPLCVAVLEDDKKDMDKSIDGITDFIGRYDGNELEEQIDILTKERKAILLKLRAEREQLFQLRYAEYERIVINGEAYSPWEAARFIQKYGQEHDWIPGPVSLYEPLPLTQEEVAKLYETNVLLAVDEEEQLVHSLIPPEALLKPADFAQLLEAYRGTDEELQENLKKLSQYRPNILVEEKGLRVGGHSLWQLTQKFSQEQLEKLLVDAKKVVGSITIQDEWKLRAILDGKEGGDFKKKWETLMVKIREAMAILGEGQNLLLGKDIQIEAELMQGETIKVLEEIREYLKQGKKLRRLSLLLNGRWAKVLKRVCINQQSLRDIGDCEAVLCYIKGQIARQGLVSQWQALITKEGGPNPADFQEDIERICFKYLTDIEFALDWNDGYFVPFTQQLQEQGFNTTALFRVNHHGDSILEELKRIYETISIELPLMVEIIRAQIFFYEEYNGIIKQNLGVLLPYCQKGWGHREKKFVGEELYGALENHDAQAFQKHYQRLQDLYVKNKSFIHRKEWLARLKVVAPDWAKAITQRQGIHGQGKVPGDIAKAWLYRQFHFILLDMTRISLEDIQKNIEDLSMNLRHKTELLTEKLAWKHLLIRMEDDLEKRQALQGFKLTAKKIGKGTGKRTPELVKQSRKLMSICQKAVPAWIMPIHKALETLDPKVNKFDIVIIDEASQSDISALTIMYLAKKIVVVGDNEQVSPLAIGENIERMGQMIDVHLKNLLPNYHLYESRTSIYDIALTTFSPICLKEHFRCVPEIIQFCNLLSYHGRIQPLRDGSSIPIKPPTVAYRVKGSMQGDVNQEEAESIVALMQACMAQPEYRGATFGVIALKGEKQALYIDKLLRERLDMGEYIKRKILCGNPSHFQGDERDVIFLSLVYVNEGEGPLRMLSDGTEGMHKKRFNVAVSRAKDQLWVIHSLDSHRDLQNGDLRKQLIEHALDPHAKQAEIKLKQTQAESVFEEAVIHDLVTQGYEVIPQWQVGAYRMDMVVKSGDKKIAIECDGDKYHQGEEKIREDMQRQAILERLGWKFIRIRGSEYYGDREKTMEKVFKALNQFGMAVKQESSYEASRKIESRLLEKIKIYAQEVRNSVEEIKKVK
jgi:very-short-patch-repair endonuclease/cellulose biosynthesis protein BcsQ